jgi:hypothetical protein
MDNDGTSVKQEEDSTSTMAHLPPPEPTLRVNPQPHTPEDRPVTGQGTVRNGEASASEADLGSPPKKARGHRAEDKVMPKDYMLCDVKDLGHVIADMLMELVRINDPLPFKNSNLTRFHSRCVFDHRSNIELDF